MSSFAHIRLSAFIKKATKDWRNSRKFASEELRKSNHSPVIRQSAEAVHKLFLKEVTRLSLLLNGHEMRKRLAQILDRTNEDNSTVSENEKNSREQHLSHTGTLE